MATELLGESALIALGGAIAKALLVQLMGTAWAKSVAGDVVDIIEQNLASARRDAGQRQGINRIATSIIKQHDKWLEHELPNLQPAVRNRVILHFSRAMAVAHLTVTDLIKLKLDHNLLTHRLHEGLTVYERGLNSHERLSQDELGEKGYAFLFKLLESVSRAIVRHAPRFEGFENEMDRTQLEFYTTQSEMLGEAKDSRKKEDAIFERQYLTAITTSYDFVELFGVDSTDENQEKLRLSTAFVDLELESDDHSTRRRVTDAARPNSLFNVNSLQYLRSENAIRVLVTAKGGGGKSTLLFRFAVDAARDGLNGPIRVASIPFYVELARQVKSGLPVATTFVESTLPMYKGLGNYTWAHNVLDEGRALVLIDGIDELTSSQRGEMLDWLRSLVALYPRSSYIVTSRPSSIKAENWPTWSAWSQEKNFVSWYVKDMSDEQIGKFIRKWHEALKATNFEGAKRKDANRKAERLIAKVGKTPELRKLAANPLLCAIICRVHLRDEDLVSSQRSDLYGNCIKELLQKRGRKQPPDKSEASRPTDKELMEIVESLAYWFLRNGYTSCSFEQFRKQIALCLPCIETEAEVPNVEKYLLERSELLRTEQTNEANGEGANNRVEFAHRGFLEYLAGVAATKRDDLGVLAEHALDDHWREAISLGLCFVDEATAETFLRDILRSAGIRANEVERRRLTMLAASCLETVNPPSTKLRNAILDAIFEYVPPDSSEVALDIARGGSAVVPLLIPNEDYCIEESCLCIRSLAAIGTPHALDVIAEYAKEGSVYAEEIGNAWRSFDHQEYLKRILHSMTHVTLGHLPDKDDIVELHNTVVLNLTSSTDEDYEALSGFPNLREFHIGNSSFSNLDSLSGLKLMRDIQIPYTAVSDLSPLCKLVDLESLSIRKTPVKSLSPLRTLPKLANLDIAGASISDVEVIRDMTALRSIYVSQSQLNALGKKPAISFVRKLGLLDDLGTATDLSAISRFPGLQALVIEGSARVIRGFLLPPQLTQLTFRRAAVRLSDWLDGDGLTELSFVDSSIDDWETLASFGNVKRLSISECTPDFVVDFVRGMWKLNDLRISGMFFDLKELPGLERLTVLGIDAKCATDLRFLAKMAELETLIIYGPGQIDYESLLGSTQLEVIRL